jgi:CDGSH-type Zn-finger protein/uncharacterized Fe-S cluster protein YjdI
MTVETTTGEKIAVSFDGVRCIHARRCVTGEPAVFRANYQGPWIDADGATAQEILNVALNCPSGAITVARRDGGDNERAPKTNKIVVRENGPLAVNAETTIEGHGAVLRATLCRCGLSANKPFCDNSHIKGGFNATGEPEAKESALALTDLVGPVNIKPTTDGPYLVVGKLELESGTGRNINRVEKTFLCRCGHSKTKPYCDGSHKAAGFTAPGA